ncbi:MAG: hypothetical protein O6922_04160, partial [Chloroflexi bacterium]|nr:hypothetical protein [Chloroflexota bacterium]
MRATRSDIDKTLSFADYDFLAVDAQHSPFNEENLATICEKSPGRAESKSVHPTAAVAPTAALSWGSSSPVNSSVLCSQAWRSSSSSQLRFVLGIRSGHCRGQFAESFFQ